MKINSLEEWLSVIGGCGCCRIQDINCGIDYEFEIILAQASACYHVAFTFDGATGYYRRVEISTVQTNFLAGTSGSTTETWDQRWSGADGDVCELETTSTGTPITEPGLGGGLIGSTTVSEVGIPPADHTRTRTYEIRFPSGTLYYRSVATTTYTEAYQDPLAELGADARAKLTALEFPDDATTAIGWPKAELYFTSSPNALPTAVISKIRYRWKIPNTYIGKSVKITWDILEDLLGEDPTFLAKDLTWEWIRDPAADPAAENVSEWYYVDPPDDIGSREVVNVRYECPFNSKLGSINSLYVLGELIELQE